MILNRIFLSLVFFACVVTGCKQLDQLLTFRITNTSTFEIPGASPLNLPLNISTPEVSTNSSQEFANNDTRADLVKDIILEEITLTITAPTAETFRFLKSIHIYISTNGSNEIELAYLDNISSDDNSITLNTTKEKLDEYIKASSYKLRFSVVTKEALAQDVTIESKARFKVTAKTF